MTHIQQFRLDVLEDTVKYYSENPLERRCSGIKVGINGIEGHRCYYAPESLRKQHYSNGCAVGRLLPRETALRIDVFYPDGRGILEVFDEEEIQLPLVIHALGFGFLGDLQVLHDRNCHWNDGGLLEEGEEFIETMRQKIKNQEY